MHLPFFYDLHALKPEFIRLLLFLGDISSRTTQSNAALGATMDDPVVFTPPKTADNLRNVSQRFFGFAIEMLILPKYGGELLLDIRKPNASLTREQALMCPIDSLPISCPPSPVVPAPRSLFA